MNGVRSVNCKQSRGAKKIVFSPGVPNFGFGEKAHGFKA